MSRYLMIDIGAGTMDVLYYDRNSDLHFKAVVKSPVRSLAESASRLTGNLVVRGCEMGGGAVSKALRERAREADVVMTAAAAATLHHDPDKVRAWGIRILPDVEIEPYLARSDYSELVLQDIDIQRLRSIVEGLGVSFRFDIVGICAQDHGRPPKGVSHLDYRHNLFQQRLDRDPRPQALIFESSEVPATMNRLAAIAASASHLPADEVYVMDSGMAAILGASTDAQASAKNRILVVDAATSHTVGAALIEGEMAGFFEYHTCDITIEKLDTLLTDLADGNLDHQRVLAGGGHGAYTRRAFGFENTEAIIATGPRRGLLAGSRLPMSFGAPLGDNMMTGTTGLLEAVRIRKGHPPISCL